MDFKQILTDHRVPFVDSGSGTRPGWLNLRCIRCQKWPYLGFCVAGCYTTCWSCGSISLTEVLGHITGLRPSACWQLIGQLPKDRLPDSLVHTGKLKLPDGHSQELHPEHKAYLWSRGKACGDTFRFQPEKLQSLWQVSGIGQAGGLLKWRLLLPLVFRGEIMSWTTRAIFEQKQPRYRAAVNEHSTVPIDRLLYGIDHCRHAVCVTEGPFDAMAIGPGAVALCGSRYSSAQLEQLSKIPLRYICLDNEPVAQQRARKLAADLSVCDGVTFNLTLQSGKDAASASRSELDEIRSQLR